MLFVRALTLATMVAAEAFKDRLRAAMERVGLDAKGLAAAIGVTYQAVKKLVDGESKSLSAENVFRVADACGVDPRWLATGHGRMTAEPSAPSSLAAHLVDAVSAMPPQRWRSVRAQLDDLAEHPELRDDVLPEVQTLLNVPPRKRQSNG